MQIDHEMLSALDQAWDPASAQMSLERWLLICDREGWGTCPENSTLLIKVFGASWYFTRLIFYCGKEITKYFNHSEQTTDYSVRSLRHQLLDVFHSEETGEKLDELRLRKNKLMLEIFLASLEQKLTQEEIEQSLTNLAEAVLWCVMQILIGQKASDETDLAVLAMGRMAGNEMNFGSDLDLIFLYSADSQDNFAVMSRQVQSLLRQVASISAAGNLYEIDMRLRPHGTSGTLISSAQYFIEYHCQERQVWERQMMTRCRVIVDSNNLAEQAMDNITPAIYAEYDKEYLKNEIITMRRKVQEELGCPKGKHEIKRGVGGIMDIDFLSHYLQLLHGHKIKSIKTSSTRVALRNLAEEKILDKSTSDELLDAYDFLKQLEGRLRVHDMKSVSSFSNIAGGVHVLARAMGYMEEDRNIAAEEFLDTYTKVTKTVRQHFKTVIGKV